MSEANEHDDAAVTDLLQRLSLAPDRAAAAVDVATHVAGGGIFALQTGGLLAGLTTSLEDSSPVGAREGALLSLIQLSDTLGRAFEPFFLPLLPVILHLLADKAPAVRTAAIAAGRALLKTLSPHATAMVLPVLYDGIGGNRKWQTKEGSYILLRLIQKTSPSQITKALPDLVPNLSSGMVDARDEVKKAAWIAMNGASQLLNNRDLEPCVPAILSSIARPAEVSETIIKLSALVFVQAIEAPALAIMVPLLMRGLQKETAIKRRCAVIISNMSKLVNNPHDAHLFLPTLLPRLEQVGQEAADPELRSVAATAHATVLKIAGEAEQGQGPAVKKLEVETTGAKLREIISNQSAGCKVDDFMSKTLSFITEIAVLLVTEKKTEFEEWDEKVVTPYLAAFMSAADAKAVCKTFLDWCIAETREADECDDDDDEPGADLCNCTFSLAYGGKILLNNARLRLKLGHRYGLCGANGAGKSTLMKAINRGQVDGFPPKSEVVTVYVEHDIDASLTETSVADFVWTDKQLMETTAPPREDVVDMLASVGFNDEMQNNPVTSLSGGWKMKLALARAMLMKPHILLLDEPTNHLDSTNVAWLEHYLVNLPDVTSMIVSHDSGFLDHVCTDIMHYENRKLKRYRGNLSEFVKAKPEAKSYYSLDSASLRFNFPRPGFLDGINTNEKPIMWMKKVEFTYPGATKKQLIDINIQCRLASRVAVLGANGAGKSTLIKLLTGEMKPDGGTIFKHPNLRVAYVAQHAFHHIEDFLDKTPNQYIRARYLQGEDKEENSKVHRVLSKEEEQALARQVWMIDGQPRILDKIAGRRKKKRSYEYEVKWQGLSSIAFNRWIPREVLEEKGFEKILNQFDGAKAAAAVGQDARPLTQSSIESYLADFGLDPEFGTHSFIRGLSGGQKVKLVLAAAMWLNPQMLIMDEPTNYLDRESLGALATAIKDFGGGVVIISHHAEFTSALCQEVWTVADHRCTVTGKSIL